MTTASPGSAPRTRTGPAIGASGWPSHAGVNGTGTSLMSATSAKAPRTVSCTSSPGSIVSAGGVAGLTSNRYHRRSVIDQSPRRGQPRHDLAVGLVGERADLIARERLDRM